MSQTTNPALVHLRQIVLSLDENLGHLQEYIRDCDANDLDPLVRAGNHLALSAVLLRERLDAQIGRGTAAPWTNARIQAEIAALMGGQGAGGTVLFAGPAQKP